MHEEVTRKKKKKASPEDHFATVSNQPNAPDLFYHDILIASQEIVHPIYFPLDHLLYTIQKQNKQKLLSVKWKNYFWDQTWR